MLKSTTTIIDKEGKLIDRYSISQEDEKRSNYMGLYTLFSVFL